MLQRALAAGALAAALAAASASAQDAGPASGMPPPSRSEASTAAPAGAVANLPTGLAPTEWRAKKLIGADIYGPDDQVIGDVADLIVELDGRISAFVVSTGGFLGFGGRQVAVPTEDIKIGQSGHLTVNLTQEQLDRAPEFDFGERAATRAGPMAAPSGTSSGAAVGPRSP